MKCKQVIARTGKMICCDHHGFKPDILILGKALSMVAYFLYQQYCGRDEIMLTIKPGEHGSTFGGNPLACAVAMVPMEALKVVTDENLCAPTPRLWVSFSDQRGWAIAL